MLWQVQQAVLASAGISVKGQGAFVLADPMKITKGGLQDEHYPRQPDC